MLRSFVFIAPKDFKKYLTFQSSKQRGLMLNHARTEVSSVLLNSVRHIRKGGQASDVILISIHPSGRQHVILID
jgi:hypothetical protein